jgi:hypothetical protein
MPPQLLLRRRPISEDCSSCAYDNTSQPPIRWVFWNFSLALMGPSRGQHRPLGETASSCAPARTKKGMQGSVITTATCFGLSQVTALLTDEFAILF